LAKVLMTAIKPPGFMQQVRIGIDAQLIWRLHKQGVVYAMETISGYNGLVQQQKMKYSVKFFDLLSQMLFGVQATADQITSM
jgi:cohesin complex subunit SA-1/2